MKNMLAVAGLFTVLFSILLVWMDKALADRIEEYRPEPAKGITILPQTQTAPVRTLPEVIIRGRRGKSADLQNPAPVCRGRRV